MYKRQLLIREPTEKEKAEISRLPQKRRAEISEARNEPELVAAAAAAAPFNVHPRNAVKTAEFYIIWVGFFACSTANNFIGSYSKPFAQQYIKDDQFFSNVAVATALTNVFGRIIWGKVFDWQGYQVDAYVPTRT